MKDNSTEMLLMVLFGILGLAVICLAWLRPMPEAERALTTLVGVAGLLPALGKGLFHRANRRRAETESVPVRVEDRS